MPANGVLRREGLIRVLLQALYGAFYTMLNIETFTLMSRNGPYLLLIGVPMWFLRSPENSREKI